MTPIGRPEIGPLIQIRLNEETLATIDELAESRQASRAEIARQLIDIGLTHQDELGGPVDFPDYLIRRMHEAGITSRAELAQRAGISASTISRWMSGAAVPDNRGRAALEAGFRVKRSERS